MVNSLREAFFRIFPEAATFSFLPPESVFAPFELRLDPGGHNAMTGPTAPEVYNNFFATPRGRAYLSFSTRVEHGFRLMAVGVAAACAPPTNPYSQIHMHAKACR